MKCCELVANRCFQRTDQGSVYDLQRELLNPAVDLGHKVVLRLVQASSSKRETSKMPAFWGVLRGGKPLAILPHTTLY